MRSSRPLTSLTLILSVLPLPVWLEASPAVESAGSRPNILLILADDMGWSDLGCYGGEIATPNLDRLARGGLRFTRFHNTAKCFPSRACLLTGLYAQECGMDRRPGAIVNGVTLAEVLREAGYRTLMTGKHHGTQNPFDLGFDHYYGLRDGAANYFNPGHPRPGEPDPAQKRPGQRYWCFDDEVLQPFTPAERDFYSTDYYTKWALRFLEKYRGEDKPWFLYVAYQAPHDPLQAWPRDIAKYRGKYRAGYEAIAEARDRRQRDLGLIDVTSPRSAPTHRPWADLSAKERDDQDSRMAVYAAMIECMDRNIGRLLDWIEGTGEAANTLILFASDNGCSAEVVRKGRGEIGSMTRWASLGRDWANVSNTPFRFYKNYSHEGGIRTPLIAHWPNRIAGEGRLSRFPGHFIDLLPTLLDVANARYPDEYRGKPVLPFAGQSLMPVFLGRESARLKPLFWQWSKGKAVLDRNWKLVSWDGAWELYDMENDGAETVDVATRYPDVAARLAALHTDWRARVGR